MPGIDDFFDDDDDESPSHAMDAEPAEPAAPSSDPPPATAAPTKSLQEIMNAYNARITPQPAPAAAPAPSAKRPLCKEDHSEFRDEPRLAAS